MLLGEGAGLSLVQAALLGHEHTVRSTALARLLGRGWVDGVILSLLGGVLCALGLTLQRTAWLRCVAQRSNQAKGDAAETDFLDPWCRGLGGPTGRLWLLGSAINALSGLCDTFSYLFASNTVLAVLACSHPVLTSLAAVVMLGETYTGHDLAGSTGCVVGAMGVLAFAPHKSMGSGFIRELLWSEPVCRVYMALMFTLLCGLMALQVRPPCSRGKPQQSARLKACALPMIVATSGTLVRLWNVQLGMALAEAERLGGVWPLLAPLAGTAALQLVCSLITFVFTQRGIADPARENHVFVPSCFAFSIVLQCLQSVVIGEFASTGILQVVATFMSACVAVGGVFVMHVGQDAGAGSLRESSGADYGAA